MLRIQAAGTGGGRVRGQKCEGWISHLVRQDGSFRIALKRVMLANCDGSHAPMTIPL